MINILIPSCGNSEFFSESYYPKTLYEVNGLPMIQLVVNTFSEIKDRHYIFMFLQSECDRFHTDNVVSILTKGTADIIRLKEVTGGALCSCLMAIEYINNENELFCTSAMCSAGCKSVVLGGRKKLKLLRKKRISRAGWFVSIVL